MLFCWNKIMELERIKMNFKICFSGPGDFTVAYFLGDGR